MDAGEDSPAAGRPRALFQRRAGGQPLVRKFE
jgi:hypothetical protein